MSLPNCAQTPPLQSLSVTQSGQSPGSTPPSPLAASAPTPPSIPALSQLSGLVVAAQPAPQPAAKNPEAIVVTRHNREMFTANLQGVRTTRRRNVTIASSAVVAKTLGIANEYEK
jgi:hypothetical protein